jgi:hypothetical protein
MTAVLEILTFRLLATADEDAFREADRRLQTDFAYQQPGLLRRTTARSDAGEWVVIDLWRSAEDADACDRRWGTDEVTPAFMAMVDPESVKSARYATLD